MRYKILQTIGAGCSINANYAALFSEIPFRGQTKLELHPNLLEMYQKNDVPPSIHEADAIAYISNHKISELNLENPI